VIDFRLIFTSSTSDVVTFETLKQKFGAFRSYLIILVALLGSAYLGYQGGHYFTALQLRQLNTLQQTNQNLKKENAELSQNYNVLRVELEVAKLSEQKTFEEIKQGLEREKALQQDIAFYQQVMAPELSQQGFVIDAFNVSKSLSDRAYRFEIVLMQREKINNTLKGTLDVVLIGSEAGNAKQYALKDLLVDQNMSLNFGFKYFQVVEGEIQLPENFLPERVLINTEIYQFNRKKGDLQSSFNWVQSNPSE
jgi:hypothetical protein